MCPGFSSRASTNIMDLSMATCNAEKANMKSNEYRKVIKPLLERRRRARINSCLDELKALILENAQNENTDASKLEKADILELTVQHLRSLRQSSRSWPVAKPALKTVQADKFRAGFAECAHEVSTYISSLGAVESDTKSRLLTHLAHCINRIPVLPMACCPQPSVAMDSPHLRGVHLTTPTPPPSPMSPLQSCRSATDYVVPVSPISPAPYSDYAGQYPAHEDAYSWSDSPSSRSSISRSSFDTHPSSQYEDQCCRSPSRPMPYSRSKTPAGHEHYTSKPWRPW